MQAIADTLKAFMGMDVRTVGTTLIERVVRERMALLDMDDEAAYLVRLNQSRDELQQLVELAVVPETWFFRDREAMLAVARLGREKLVAARVGKLRILSLPCSTGEEPYSLAMALFDAGVPASAFHIDAIDIRTRSLEIAAAGVYGRNSFRGRDLAFRDRYFVRQGTAWRISAEVAAQVNFAPGNLLARDFMQHTSPYDFILCRNVLIYFEREVQHRVVRLLEALLKDDGHIFVGPAEGGLLLSERVVSAGIPLAFGFRKRTPQEIRASAVPPAAPTSALPVMPVSGWPVAKTASRTPVRRRAALPDAANAAHVAKHGQKPAVADGLQGLLAQARQAADQGDLARAGALCDQAVREHGASADAFYLQGLLSDAGGDAAAAQRSYRKAIYLDPAHHEALQHLAALLQAQGDAAGARLMRQRAERAERAAMHGALHHG